MFLVFLIIAGVVGLLFRLILIKATNDSGKAETGVGALYIGIGIIFREIARIRMEVIDGYTWEGNLCDYEVETYGFLYTGLLFLLIGIVGTALSLYSALKKQKDIKEDE